MILRIIILASLAAVLVAYAASLILGGEQESAYQAFVGSGARISDPGYNLVGRTWDGLATLDQPQSLR
jgi:hypothetical protein